MKLSVLQENLDKALTAVSRLVQTTNSLPILGNILLQTKDGQLELQATNLEIAIAYKIGAKIETKGSISVPARLFTELVHSLPNDKIQLSSIKDNLEIHTDQLNSVINGINAADFPTIPTLNTKKQFTISTKSLVEALEFVLSSVSLDESRPILTGVYCKSESGVCTFAATDSYRLSQYKIKTPKIDDLEIIIPYKTIQEVIRIIKTDNLSEITVSITDSEIVFSSENITLTSQLIEGSYPDYTKIIPESHTTIIGIEKNDLVNSLKIASLFSRENANTISLDIVKNSLSITSEGTQIGKNISKITAKVTGDDQQINLNARYIIDALTNINDSVVSIAVQGKLDPCVISSSKQSADNFHIIMPLRS
ncbi:DNA polymerase III subunit beta [Candidatus Saccharibacteria bacterium]|nr:DNA polymerase III subunit beta [Candidatus Saccharibacteria bacterium]